MFFFGNTLQSFMSSASQGLLQDLGSFSSSATCAETSLAVKPTLGNALGGGGWQPVENLKNCHNWRTFLKEFGV